LTKTTLVNLTGATGFHAIYRVKSQRMKHSGINFAKFDVSCENSEGGITPRRVNAMRLLQILKVR